MPIRNVTTDYSGRQKDISAFSVVNPLSPSRQAVTPTFGRVSSYCAGVQKLIQRYTIALLTTRGSQPAFPDFGTELLAGLAVSGLSTVSDLTHAFNFANALVVVQFRDYQSRASGIPLDEQLDTAVLSSLTTTASFEVTFTITLYTMAGTTIDYLLPIPITK